MQEPVLSATTAQKLYSQRGILIGCILGGPIVAAYLMNKNYNSLEQKEKRRQTWLLCISAFATITALSFLLPKQVPSLVFIFLNAAFGYYAVQNLQGKLIDKHVSDGGLLHSNWRCAGVAILFAVVVIALALAAFLMMDLYTGRI